MTRLATEIITARAALALVKSAGQIANRLTRAAMADVDTGHVVDHLAVQAWVDSLDTDNPLPVPR